MSTALTFALLVMEWAPTIQRGIAGTVEMIEWGRERVQLMRDENRDPTPAEWDELNQRIAALRDALHSDED